jgi:uncharacterized protein (DUF2062 family)
VEIMVRRWVESRKGQAADWLRQGCSPRRLALTLALGFAIGCIPMVGTATALCLVVALVLRLNLGAIQAANCLAMPLQVALIVPFLRLGNWMFAAGQQQAPAGPPVYLLTQFGSMAGQAMAAWIVIAGPVVVLLTLCLTPVLRRVPTLAVAETAK